MENRRDYYRLFLVSAMCAEIFIYKVKDVIKNSGKTHVCVLNISSGGVQFKSKLNLPENDIVYKILFKIYDKEYEIESVIKWKKQNKDNTYSYGLMFLLNDKEKEHLIQTISKLTLQVKNKKNELYSECKKRCPNVEGLKLK